MKLNPLNVRSFWLEHPHMLRVWCALLFLFAPLVWLGTAIGMHWREVVREISTLYAVTWAGITHKLPSKPFFRPLARLLGWVAALRCLMS